MHRDIKPANLFLANDGEARIAKLLDFGISKLVDAEEKRVTQTGLVLGTPMYMSPEQIRSSKTVDHRTDVWSLGVVLYECLTGRPPFDFCDKPGGKGTDAALGTVVITPSGDREAKVSVRLVAGFDAKSAETCIEDLQGGETASTIESCVVARRSIAFLPSRPFTLPIGLWFACVGKDCAGGQTCVDGQCISEEVDPEQCLKSEGCGDAILYLLNEGGGGSGGAPPSTLRRVFVTSLTTFGASISGLGGADKLCQKLANDAKLGGTYLAWLSTDKESPATRFTKDGPGWALVDGTVVAESWSDLTDGTLQHAIDKTEAGTPAPTTSACSATTTPVWSQTAADGTFAHVGEATASDPKWDCDDWGASPATSQDKWGDAGATDGRWTRSENCNTFGVSCVNKLAAL